MVRELRTHFSRIIRDRCDVSPSSGRSMFPLRSPAQTPIPVLPQLRQAGMSRWIRKSENALPSPNHGVGLLYTNACENSPLLKMERRSIDSYYY